MPYKDKEKRKAYHKAYRDSHKEERRAYEHSHREQTKARSKAYYDAHREEQKAYSRAYRAFHKDKVTAANRAYHIAHREERNAYSRKRGIEKKRSYIWCNYGLTVEEYNTLKVDSLYCPICGVTMTEGSGKVKRTDKVLDH